MSVRTVDLNQPWQAIEERMLQIVDQLDRGGAIIPARKAFHAKMTHTVVTLDTLRNEKRAEVLRLAQSHGARNVRVFGSLLHGDNRSDSDIDLLVEFDEGRTLLDLIGLKLDLEELLGPAVDITTPNSLRYIHDRVLAEALPI